MSLPDFIRGHHLEIISEFAAFAKTLMPPGAEMTDAELRDHAEEILTAIVEDMHLRQTPDEQHRKSQGRGSAHSMETAGRLHAVDRIAHGYAFQAVLAEFRALRASVLRRYEETGATDFKELRRFNEAIDEALTESMREFAGESALLRERQAFFLKLADALRLLDDPQQIKLTATRLLGEQLRVNRVFYADARGGYWLPTKGYETGIDTLPDQPFAMSEYGDWIIDGLRTGRRLVVSDMHADGRLQKPQREAHLALHIGAEVAVPLVKAGELIAMLVAHNDRPREWSEPEIAILEETAERTWTAAERARAEGALRASEEKYRTLFNSIDEGFCVFEMIYDDGGAPVDYRFVEVNPAFERHTALADAVGKTICEMVPGHEQKWFDLYGRVAETGEPLRIEDRAEGLGRWYDIYAFRIGDPDSRTVAAVFADVTARKRAEGELRHRAEQFETLIRQAPIGVYLVDADSRIAQVNPVARPVFGDIPDLIGRDFDEVIHVLWQKPYADEVTHLFRHTLETGEPYATPERAQYRADRGLLEYYAWRIDRITLPNGGYGVVCYFSDISGQVRARHAIAESEKKYRSLFESIDEGFCIIEMIFDGDKAVDYRFVEVNPAFERHTGIADAQGRRMREIAPDHEEHWFKHYGDIALTGEPQRFEAPAKHLGDRWYDLNAFRVGEPTQRHVAIVFSDITQRQRDAATLRDSEERLRRLNEQLEERVRERTAEINALLIRVIQTQEEERRRIAREIHDQLGQQMTALRMNLELWQSKSDGNQALMAQADRTQLLAEELDRSIDFLTRELRPAALEHFGLSAALRNVITSWSERFAVAAELDVSGDFGRFATDVESNIYRVVQEALHNVAKHADATHVTVSIRGSEEEFVLVIEDNGRGFDRMATAERHGSGLGLVSMRERATLIGGALEIESRPGAGTAIFVRVPRVCA